MTAMPDVSTDTQVSVKADKSTKKGFGPIAALLVTIGIYLVSQFVGSLILLGVARGRGWDQHQINLWVQQTLPQFLYIVLVEAASIWLLWRFLKRRRFGFQDIGWHSFKSSDLWSVAVGAVIYFPVLVVVMGLIQAYLPQVNLSQPQQIGFNNSHGLSLILAFISLVILPPLAEELLVRGFLYTGLRTKLPKLVAAVVASLVFAAAHLEFGSGAKLLWSAAADTFILSMVLVYLRERTGSLWASIGLHMTKNCLAFAALFIFVK